MIRVVLPHHLRVLAGVQREVLVDIDGIATIGGVIDVLETEAPALRGTIRDPATRARRPFIRFFACEEDLSNAGMDAELPDPVAQGREPLHVVGAMAGG